MDLIKIDCKHKKTAYISPNGGIMAVRSGNGEIHLKGTDRSLHIIFVDDEQVARQLDALCIKQCPDCYSPEVGKRLNTVDDTWRWKCKHCLSKSSEERTPEEAWNSWLRGKADGGIDEELPFSDYDESGKDGLNFVEG